MSLPALLLVLALAAGPALAHKPSDSYLALRADGAMLEGQWDIALRDLEHAVGLDADGNGAITWGELKAKRTEVEAYAFARLGLGTGGAACRLTPTDYLVDTHSDGAYVVLRFSAQCPSAADLTVNYSLFSDLDPTHRGLLRSKFGEHTVTAVLGPDQPNLKLRTDRSRWEQFLDYAKEGVWHIWIGFDHILFLLALLLPAVLVRRERRWGPSPSLRGAALEVVKVVTAFTLAHSVTLSLAALQVVTLPSRLVESVIAEIARALERGEMVKISSFGSFAVRQKGQRIGRNPKTGQEVPISPRRVLVFRASHVLKHQINDGHGEPAPASVGTTAPRRSAKR